MKQNLRVSLGAVVLALATLAAMIFAWLNFVQRETFDTPDDGVAWLDTSSGAQAWKLAPNSPAARAGIRPGDLLISINNVPVTSQVQVTRRLWHAGLWNQVRYKLSRNGREFNPFLAINELMTNKLSPQAWTARCQELSISQLALLPSTQLEQNAEPSAKAELA